MLWLNSIFSSLCLCGNTGKMEVNAQYAYACIALHSNYDRGENRWQCLWLWLRVTFIYCYVHFYRFYYNIFIQKLFIFSVPLVFVSNIAFPLHRLSAFLGYLLHFLCHLMVFSFVIHFTLSSVEWQLRQACRRSTSTRTKAWNTDGGMGWPQTM